ncbi:MAG: NAD-dependent deacetylase [Glaciimonas sp.]|nr:NAD-dependent deacetylase [Glaciimonas sp.]
MSIARDIDRAAQLLKQADGLLITAGAGMGVDSGLPDFRGDQGFWKAYPPLSRANIRFTEIASPTTFKKTPELAWGFYGHRLQLYRDTVPHQGFEILRMLSAGMATGCFVFTSNVDGQFQKAGFDAQRIVECHGSIHVLQCYPACTSQLWSANAMNPDIDTTNCLLLSALPHCVQCGGVARPNILMFNDSEWVPDRTDVQENRFDAWLRTTKRPLVLELGAGTNISSVRSKGKSLKAPLIRINPSEPGVSGPDQIALQIGALEGLRLLWAAVH